MTSPVLQHLQAPASARATELLTDDVVFHSPVADYRGRADVAHLLTTIAAVLGELTPTRTLAGEDTVTTFLTASVEGHALDGVLDERRDAAGRVAEATLLLRPYAALRAGIAQMQARLEADPLPSRRRPAPVATRPLMILVAGPYRGGTGDDPELIAANHRRIQAACLELFRAGHLAVNGEDLALPLAALAGSTQVGDAGFDEVFHPMGRRLVARCDAVLRLPGTSAGADEMVALARANGAAVYTDLDDVPPADRPNTEEARVGGPPGQ